MSHHRRASDVSLGIGGALGALLVAAGPRGFVYGGALTILLVYSFYVWSVFHAYTIVAFFGIVALCVAASVRYRRRREATRRLSAVGRSAGELLAALALWQAVARYLLYLGRFEAAMISPSQGIRVLDVPLVLALVGP